MAYYLLLDNRFRVASGYLGAEFQESMVSFEYLIHKFVVQYQYRFIFSVSVVCD